MKSILLWGGVGVALVIGLIVVFTLASPQETPFEAGSVSTEVSGQDHRKGNVDSSVVLIEYGDFQCPACRSYFPLLKQVEQDFGGQIGIVYRHFPLNQIHPNAQEAAQASEAAALQGKFWEMHDILFERQNDWAKKSNVQEIFEQYAQELGLDGNRFNQDFSSDVVKDRVREDLQSALESKISSTPSFFLANERILNPQNYDEFRRIITAALEKAGVEPAEFSDGQHSQPESEPDAAEENLNAPEDETP
jgi:protein-disulfide isomerase